MNTYIIKVGQVVAIIMLLTLIVPFSIIQASDYDIFMYNGIKYQVTSEENKTVQTYPYSETNNTYYSGEIVIPSTVENNGTIYTVTKIGWWSFSTSQITAISLPPTIQSIGASAFALTPLKEIVLPSAVKQIDSFAFAQSQIETITLNEGLEIIGEQAFHSCINVQDLTLPNSLKKLGNGAFIGMKSLKSITIPGGVDVIGKGAFFLCDSLSEVYIEEGVRAIDDEAFYRCKSIQIMRLPSSITYIGGDAIRCVGDMYLPKPYPPNGRGDMSWCDAVYRLHIPVGTLQHYSSTPYWGLYGTVEDAELGTYCDLNITASDCGEVLVDSTYAQFYKNFVFTQAGNNVKVTFVPQEKYLIDKVTLGDNDITDKIVGATIYNDTHEMDFSDEIVPNGTYTINNIQESINLEASFVREKYTKLAIRQGIGGTISVRVHREEPLHVEVNTLNNSQLIGVSLNGVDCMGTLYNNTLYLGTIDDPALLEIEYSNAAEN